jgi:hypothetical protein
VTSQHVTFSSLEMEVVSSEAVKIPLDCDGHSELIV